MGNAKRFIKSSSVYFLGNVLTKIISFFLLPIYTNLIATDAMGYFDYTTSLLNIITPVICLEIWSGIMRYMFDYADKDGKYKVIFNGFIIFSASILLYSIIFSVLGITCQFDKLLFIFLYGIFMMLQMVYSYVIRGLGYNTLFAVSGIVSSLVNSFSNIVFMLAFGMRLNSLYIAAILGFFVQIVILEAKSKLLSNFKLTFFDAKLIKEMIRFSLPLSLNSVCYWLLSDYNRIAIKNVLGLSENGIFSIAGRFTTVLTLVSTCFSLAWQELVYSKGNDKDKSKFYNTASNYYLKFVLVALLILVPAVRLIFPFLINKQYNAAFGLIPLNLLACCASIYSGFLGNIFGAEKKNNVVMYSTVVAAAVNVGVLHLLIGSIGIQAANISLFLGFLANIIMRLILLNKTVKLKFDFKFLFITVIIFIIGYYIYFQCGLLVNFIFAVLLFILSLFVFKDLVKMAVKIIREKINKHI